MYYRGPGFLSVVDSAPSRSTGRGGGGWGVVEMGAKPTDHLPWVLLYVVTGERSLVEEIKISHYTITFSGCKKAENDSFKIP